MSHSPVKLQMASALVALVLAIAAGIAIGGWLYWWCAAFFWVVVTPLWVGNIALGGGFNDPPIHVFSRIKQARQHGLFDQ